MTTNGPSQSIPYRRNPFFTGRGGILTVLHDALIARHTVALTQAISGLGGIGKTQVAIEYIYRYQHNYDTILWANAGSRDRVLLDFALIAKQLDLPAKNENDQNRMVAAVMKWLTTNTKWLLVLDSIDDLSIASEFIPTAYRG